MDRTMIMRLAGQLCAAWRDIAFAACAAASLAIGSSGLQAEEIDAFGAVRKMGRGVNILGFDGIWDGGINSPFRPENFAKIRAAGFRHVRINLHAFKYMGRNGQLALRTLESLDGVIRRSIENDLIPVLDEHDFYECQRYPLSCRMKLLTFWEQIAERYAGRFPSLIFELLNEPGGAMTQDLWNALIPQLMHAIRRHNPSRSVVVAAINSEDPQQVQKLRLPAEDRNIIVTVHYYKPMQFTHQGAEWSREFARLKGVDWGTESDRAQVTRDFEIVNAWAKQEKRPIYLGEFGVYDRADMQARARYLSFVAREAERLGWAWAYWQFDHDFALYDTSREQWVLPVLRALIPQPVADRHR